MKPIPSLSTEPVAVDAPFKRVDDLSVEPQGQTLRSLLDLCAWLDCRRAAEIALAIAERLDAAERRGESPLGLRPERILVGEGEGPAVVIEDRTSDTSPRVVAQYLSPEEVRGESTDSRSDLYALGVVLYEMLTDRVPFDGRDADAIKHRHLHRPPEPPKIFRTDAPDALSILVMRLLEKDPARRPQRAADIFADLRQVIGAETKATKQSQAAAQTEKEKEPDVLALPDYLPAQNRNEQFIEDEQEPMLDLEFYELLNAESAREDEGAPDIFDQSNFDDSNQGTPDILDNRNPATCDDTALLFAEPQRNRLIERDPFDVPLVSDTTHGASAAAPLALEGQAANTLIKEKRAAAEAGDARLRWVALLLLGLIAAVALVLYIVIKPAAIRSDDTVTPLHTSPAVEQAAPAANLAAADIPPNGRADGIQPPLSPADPANGPTASTSPSRYLPASVSANPARSAARQWKRKSGGGSKSHSSKHKKRSRTHRGSWNR